MAHRSAQEYGNQRLGKSCKAAVSKLDVKLRILVPSPHRQYSLMVSASLAQPESRHLQIYCASRKTPVSDVTTSKAPYGNICMSPVAGKSATRKLTSPRPLTRAILSAAM